MFELLELLVLLKFSFLLLEQLGLQWWEVGADLQLDLLLGHVFELFVLLVQGESLGIIDIPELVVLSPVVFLLVLLSLLVVGLEVLLKRLVLTQAGVEPVFDIIVDSTWHELLDLDPFVAKVLVEFHQLQILGHGPLILIQIRVDVVVPPLPALLTDPAWQKGSDLLPLLEAILRYFLS